MSPRRLASAVAALLIVASSGGGCRDASADGETQRWIRVAQDDAYDIYLDTARIRSRIEGRRPQRVLGYEVWYRTEHQAARLYKGKQFNREIVRSIVRCDSLWYKVVSVDMSMGDDAPISEQRMTPADVLVQAWRRVERGTSEEIAAQAACHFGSKQKR